MTVFWRKGIHTRFSRTALPIWYFQTGRPSSRANSSRWSLEPCRSSRPPLNSSPPKRRVCPPTRTCSESGPMSSIRPSGAGKAAISRPW